jgi:hypothetical protein
VSIRVDRLRSFAQVDRDSAELADFVSRDPRHGLEAFVFIGWLVPLLALLGFVLHRRTGLGLVLGAAALLPMVLALGANLPGYEALWETVPGLGVTRVPGRLMVITGLALAGLAAFGLEWILQQRRGLKVGRARPSRRLALSDRLQAPPRDEGTRRGTRDGGRLLRCRLRARPSEASVTTTRCNRASVCGYSTVAPEDMARVLREPSRAPTWVPGRARRQVPRRLRPSTVRSRRTAAQP